MHNAKDKGANDKRTRATDKAMADLDEELFSSKLEVISFDKNNHWNSKTLSQVENIKGLFTLNFGSSYTKEDMQRAVEVTNVIYKNNQNPASENFDINKGIKIPIGKHRDKTFYFRLGHGASNYHGIVGRRA